MPTGYTQELTEKDVPLERFVLTCAKAFISRMKEMSGPIPKQFKPSDYYEKEIRQVMAKLTSLKAMSAKQAQAESDKDYEKAQKDRERYVQEVTALSERLMAMRAQVAGWQPPTNDHQGLKDFMIQQLCDTLDHDGKVLGDPPEKKSGRDWKAYKIADLEERLVYYEKEQRKEILNVEDSNLWVKRLRDSLETPHESTKK